MSVSVTFNGTVYEIPTTGEVGWDSQVTNFLSDVGNHTVTQTSTLTLTNKVTQNQAGTALAPSYSFASDTSTGMYHPSSGHLALSTMGVQALVVDGSQNITIAGSLLVPTQSANNNSTNAASTAFVCGQAGTGTPVMDGSATVGTSLLFARQDHVHATDTACAPIASPTFTGTVTAPTLDGTNATITNINATSSLAIGGSAVTTKAYVDSEDTSYYAAAQSYAATVALDYYNDGVSYTNGQISTYWTDVNAYFLNLSGGTLTGGLNVDGTVYISGTSGTTGSGSYIVEGGYSGPTGWGWAISLTTAGGCESTGFMTYSDGRAKENIEDITSDEAIDWVMRGRPRKYTLDGMPSTGFVAQEEMDNGRVASLHISPSQDPRFAKSDGYAADGFRLSKNYIHEIAYLTAALQSALTRIAALENR